MRFPNRTGTDCIINSKIYYNRLVECEMEKLDRIQINPKICLGEPIVRGTRITVSVILKLLANNRSIEDIIEIYPELEVPDIQEALSDTAIAK